MTPPPSARQDESALESSLQSPRLSRLVTTLTETNLGKHWAYLESQRRLDPTLVSHTYNETGIIVRDLAEDILDIPGMFDPRIHLPNAPIGWMGYEDATPLSNELIAYMAVRGRPLTVAEFMRQALTHPKHGYYTNPTKPDTVEFRASYVGTTPSNEEKKDNTINEDDADDDLWDTDDITTNTTPDNYIIGKKGDFVTAPEVSQVFGECLSVWFITQYETLGSPKEIQFVEVGPGKGTLIQDILRSLCTSFRQKMGSSISKVHLVEASHAMQQEQRRKLEALDLDHVRFVFEPFTNGDSSDHTNNHSEEKAATIESPMDDGKQVIAVHWHATFSSFLAMSSDEPLPSFLVCQEFIDALPVHAFEKTSNGWRERMVDVSVAEDNDPVTAQDNDPDSPFTTKEVPDANETIEAEKKTRLRIVLSPNITPACKTLLHVDPETGLMQGDDSPIGQVCEVCPEGILLVQDIATLLKVNGGAALIVDYGQEGSTDSLRGFSRHKQVNFLCSPGQVDVTADVDFEALRRSVNESVTDVTNIKSVFAFGPVTQAKFLASMGIVERVLALIEDENTTDDEAEDLYFALERLLLPEQMGERYKVLAIARKKDAIFAPPGF